MTCYFTPIAQETRRNVIICAKRRRTQTMVNAKGPLVAPQEWRAFLTHLGLLDLRGAYVVLGGSLPRGVPQDAYRQIIALVQRQGAKAVLDADGPCFKAGLKARPFAIKPNLNELRRLTGRPFADRRRGLGCGAGAESGGGAGRVGLTGTAGGCWQSAAPSDTGPCRRL
ncbi:MAG: hypothetical protein KatS3mg082_0580 [Nitrospiraceae bacterium]|nr:MAG: hypothetical protein KatS3mg082_0580 [Nitrospiraceae bacterium]